METTRQQKINRLIQKELSEIFLLQTKKMPGILISVSAVRVSPDLGIAKAYLSIFPSEKGKELMENIKANSKAIRYDLGQRVGKQLRVIPELTFFIDDSLDYLEKIDKLLDKDKDKNESKD
ncbi:MAG: 30S ribosome-binding factor RbfA [Dysgonomonas sp.]